MPQLLSLRTDKMNGVFGRYENILHNFISSRGSGRFCDGPLVKVLLMALKHLAFGSSPAGVFVTGCFT